MIKIRKYKSARIKKANSSSGKKDSMKNHSVNEEGNSQKSLSHNNIESAINSSGSGFKLPDDIRSYMERRFGFDFGFVRIHTDSNAIQLSKLFKAQAFTFGNDIYFNKGKYSAITSLGKHLLAHELTHVIQQFKGIQTKLIQRSIEAEQPKNGQDIDMCSGWDRDAESITIAAAKHFFKTESDKDIQVQKVECDPSKVLVFCKLTLSDGTIVNVHYNPNNNIVRVQVRDASGNVRYCRYKYSCSSDGSIIFTKLSCG